jgi:hypothetical protein
MSIETYRIIHIAGLVLVSMGLGGVLLRPSTDTKPHKRAAICHGIGLLAMLVAGFGLLAKRAYEWPWPNFIFIKIGIWLLLGAMPVLVKRGVIPIGLGWLVAVLAGLSAVYLGVHK